MREITVKILNLMGWEQLPGWLSALVAGINVILVLIIAFITRQLVRRFLTSVHNRLERRAIDLEDRKRLETINRIIGYVASVVIGVITFLLVLGELGISIAPLLATAGVAGIAISFGAQSLVKDYFVGFVMLLENQIRQGDFIEVAGKSGTVEEVTLRYVRLRDGEGAVHYVPNGTITTVSNHSRQFAYALVDVGVAYDTDLDKAFEVLREIGQQMRENAQFQDKIIGEPEVMGVNGLGDSAIMIRVRLRTIAAAKWPVKRKLMEMITQEFPENGIEIPFSQQVVHLQGVEFEKNNFKEESANQ